MRPLPPRLPAAVTIAGTVAAIGATLAPLPASAGAERSGGHTLAGPAADNVTVFLKPPHPAALTRLAANHTLDRAASLAALQRLLPSAAERHTAIAALHAAGLTVTDESSWSITAAAAAPTVVARAFGSRPAPPTDPARTSTAATGTAAAAAGPLPRMPAALARVATAVYPTTGGPAALHADASTRPVDGSAIRNAYTSPARTFAGQAPYAGQGTGSTLTVATVQLSRWHSSDLASYAAEHNLPYSAGTLTQVPVGTQPKMDGGDVEVDLDQESLLSTDPYAHQRAYFASNTAAGFADAFTQVLDDVRQDARSYQGGDPNIVALSTSWGQCEIGTEAGAPGNEIHDVLEPIMKSLLAAKVTIFSSSGDDGMYDGCYRASAHRAAVDYPASSPEVVAVGGTTLAATTNAPNTGSNWTETAWSCTNFASCNNNGGGGGGESDLLPKPPWQKQALTAAPWASDRRRLVPDIASDANPDSGFSIYTSDPALTKHGGPHDIVYGGTSFAAPTQAALFTSLLASRGITTGIGDIHDDLYAALGDSNAFRDVTIGSNGAAADAARGTSASAGPGYDTVTGLGAPLWPGLAAYLFPSTAPTSTASLTLPRLHRRGNPTQLHLAWSAAPASGGSPITSVTVTLLHSGSSGSSGAKPVVQHTGAATSGSLDVTGAPGSSYVLNVVGTDSAGNQSKTARSTVVVPIDDNRFTFSRGWRHTRSATAVGGSYARASRTAATASIRVTGRNYRLVAPVGPSLGRMVVTVAGKRVRVVNLHAAHAGFRSLTVYDAAVSAGRRIVLSAARGSRGIGIDAVVTR